jgi:hypothetical protein
VRVGARRLLFGRVCACACAGKYSLFEIEEDAELADKQHAASLASSVAPSPAKAAASLTTAPCSLPAPTQTLVKLIFVSCAAAAC